MTSNKSKQWEKAIRITNYLIIPFIMVIFVIDSMNKELVGIDHTTLFLTMVSNIVLWSIILGVIRYFGKFSFRDYEFQILYHLTLIVLLTVFIINLPLYEMLQNGFIVFALVISMQIIFTLSLSGKLFLLAFPYKKQIAKVANEVNNNNYSLLIEDRKILNDRMFSQFAITINEIMKITNDMLTNVQLSTNITYESTENISTATEEVNASTEEIASTSMAMSQGASRQAELINQLGKDFYDSQHVFQEIVEEISSNTDIVSQLALQTNILALNAGIEASRAGDYGRGFAVVAENVRKLSDESKQTAERIQKVTNRIDLELNQMISGLRVLIEEVASVAEETVASAEEVAATAEEVSASMQEISSATNELSLHSQNADEFVSKYQV